MIRYCAAPECGKTLPADLPWNARYCSSACKSRAARLRAVAGAPDTATGHPGTPDTAKDAFERLRRGLPLSQWKPSPNIDPAGVPDIPEFLRRK